MGFVPRLLTLVLTKTLVRVWHLVLVQTCRGASAGAQIDKQRRQAYSCIAEGSLVPIDIQQLKFC